MKKANNKKLKKKQNIELRFYPEPYPGLTYITFMYVNDKKIGGILYNKFETYQYRYYCKKCKTERGQLLDKIDYSWRCPECNSPGTVDKVIDKTVCLILNIVVNKKHRRKGYAYKCLKAFLSGFDRIDTQVDTEAGLNLIIKAGFRTGDGINYIWEKKDETKESKETISY